MNTVRAPPLSSAVIVIVASGLIFAASGGVRRAARVLFKKVTARGCSIGSSGSSGSSSSSGRVERAVGADGESCSLRTRNRTVVGVVEREFKWGSGRGKGKVRGREAVRAPLSI